jgi:uncharacterized protein YhaN
MRIESLLLDAYGPFTDRRIDFGTGMAGLHIVFGLNEAGKSSALRALVDMLFGIPLRTEDNFLHPYSALKIGGVIGDSAERSLKFYRRKKKNNPLVDENGQTVEERELAEFLGGVTREHFELMFGLDHRRLELGGKELLSGESDFAEILFGAGIGSGVSGVVALLREREEKIHKSRGKQELDRELTRFKQLKKSVRENQLRPADYRALKSEIESLQEQRETVVVGLSDLDGELERLKRFSRLLPLVSEYDRLREKRNDLGEVCFISKDAIGQRLQAQNTLDHTRGQKEQLIQEISETREESVRLEVPRALIDHVSEIKRIGEQFGSYRNIARDREQLNLELAGNKGAIDTIMNGLGIGAADREQVKEAANDYGLQDKLLRLISRNEQLTESRNQIEKKTTAAGIEQEKISKQLGRIGKVADFALLIPAINALRSEGDLSRQLEEASMRQVTLKKSIDLSLKKLSLEGANFDEIASLNVPLAETVALFEKQEQKLAKQEESLSLQTKELGSRRSEINRQIEKMQAEDSLPTSDKLKVVRNERDRGWELIKNNWLNGENVEEKAREYDAELPLDQAYETRVEISDSLADLMFEKAETVVQYDLWSKELIDIEKSLNDLEVQKKNLAKENEENQIRWCECWPKEVRPVLTAREMDGWLKKIERVGEKLQEYEDVAAKVRSFTERITEGQVHLGEKLAALGVEHKEPCKNIAELLEFCDLQVEKNREREKRNAQLVSEAEGADNRLAELKKEIDSLEKAERQRKAEWDKQVGDYSFLGDKSEREVEVFLEQLNRLRELIQSDDEMQKRIEQMRVEQERFEHDLKTVLKACSPDLFDQPSAESAERLLARFSIAESNVARKEEIEKRYESLKKKLSEAKEKEAVAETTLNRLMAAADCEDPTGMDEIEQKSQKARELDVRIDRCEADIKKDSTGESMLEIREQLAEIDPDLLPGKIENLRAESRIQTAERDKLSEQIGTATNKLQEMENKAEQEEDAAAMSDCLARINVLAQDYARYRLARILLEAEVEKYRRDNQGPVLHRAKEYFARLTAGAYTELRVEIDDRPALVCVREDGKEVAPTGLSDGTADQLYLALRLGLLEEVMQRNQPLPFIADDLFVNFDDIRAKAGFEVLAQVAEQTQVIFFTHHRHLLELAQDAVSENILHSHEL